MIMVWMDYENEIDKEKKSAEGLGDQKILFKFLSCGELLSVELVESVRMRVQGLLQKFMVVVKVILQYNKVLTQQVNLTPQRSLLISKVDNVILDSDWL